MNTVISKEGNYYPSKMVIDQTIIILFVREADSLPSEDFAEFC